MTRFWKFGVSELTKSVSTPRNERRMLEMRSPFSLEPGTVRLLEPEEGFGTEHAEQLREGGRGHPFMIDYDGTRSLCFTIDATQSAMDLDDPYALIGPYTRKMMAFLLFLPIPRHILMIGLGGGSLAKFCYRHLPRTRISVVEICAEVIALRNEFAVPSDDHRFEIIHDDGATFLAHSQMRPDVILVDAFDELGVAPSLASTDFYQHAYRCLSPSGVLVMNLSGQRSRFVAHIDKLRSVFPGSIRLVPVENEGNLLVFAFQNHGLKEMPASLPRRAAILEERLGLEFSRYLERLNAAEILDSRRENLELHGQSSPT